MKLRSTFLASLIGATACFAVSGCASLDVDPCSREGIDLRMSRVLSVYARDNRGEINDLKQAASWMDGQTTFGAMKLAFAVQSLRKMVDRFEDDVVPEVQAIALQCQANQPLQDVFIDFLRDEGVKKDVLEWVEAFNFVFET